MDPGPGSGPRPFSTMAWLGEIGNAICMGHKLINWYTSLHGIKQWNRIAIPQVVLIIYTYPMLVESSIDWSASAPQSCCACGSCLCSTQLLCVLLGVCPPHSQLSDWHGPETIKEQRKSWDPIQRQCGTRKEASHQHARHQHLLECFGGWPHARRNWRPMEGSIARSKISKGSNCHGWVLCGHLWAGKGSSLPRIIRRLWQIPSPLAHTRFGIPRWPWFCHVISWAPPGPPSPQKDQSKQLLWRTDKNKGDHFGSGREVGEDWLGSQTKQKTTHSQSESLCI